MRLTGTRFWAGAAAAGCALLLAGADPARPQAAPKATVGRLENVWLGDARLVLPAKIDTGAHTSSLGVDSIEIFKRRGHDWVRFRIEANRTGAAGGKGANAAPAGPAAPVVLEKKVVRFAKLKKKNGPGTETRPVVLLGLCIGDIWRVTQINLVDRGRFDYPVLIGRRFLFGTAVVDVAQKYTAPPGCPEMRRR